MDLSPDVSLKGNQNVSSQIARATGQIKYTRILT